MKKLKQTELMECFLSFGVFCLPVCYPKL